MNEHEIYEKLRQAIDRHGNGFSATEAGIEIRILKKLFTEEEAQMYMHLTENLEPLEVIAARAGQKPEKVAVVLNRMMEKGFTFHKKKGNKVYCAAAPAYHGIIENQSGRLDKELAQLWEEYKFAEKIQKGPAVERPLAFAMPLRVVPVLEPVKTSRPIAPYEDVKKLIKNRKRIALIKCFCAEQQRVLGTDCDHPLECCILLGFYAEYYVKEMGMGRWITQEEAIEVLDNAEKAGLVHQVVNNRTPDGICNCCWNCCGLLQHLKIIPNPASVVSSNYYAQVDPEVCTGCQTCLDRCPIGAATMSAEDLAEINLDKCIGCGLCISTCPAEAISLVSKPEENRQVPPPENLHMWTSKKMESGIH